MKAIVIIYLVMEIACGWYIYQQIGEKIANHLVYTIPAVIFYIIVCFKDPGYTPFECSELNQLVDEIPSTSSTSTQETSGEQVQPKEMLERKYCKYCKHYRCIRMKHCYDCKKCVATFDHHCLWIDNCVGQKNRPHFYLCITWNLGSIGNAFCLVVGEMWEKGSKQTEQIYFLSFLGILIGAMVALVGLHSYMMCANITTWQIMSWQRLDYFQHHPLKGSPFSSGFLTNLKQYWSLPFKQSFKSWIPCDTSQQ